MIEQITSSRTRLANVGEGFMWEVVVSSDTFTDAHYGCFYEEREAAAAESVAHRVVGKPATFEGFRDTVAYID